MSLVFTEEQKLLQKSVRDFAENEVRPRLDEIIKSEGYIPRDLYKRMGELGFYRCLVAKDKGGFGLGLTEACIITEELSKVAPALGLILMCSMPTLFSLQDCEPFVEQYMEKCLSGDLIFSIALSPPEGLTNPSEWQPMVKKAGKEWRLNGTKLFCTSSVNADINEVLCLDENNSVKTFIVRGDEPGITHNAPEIKFGMKGSGGGTVVYKDCRVPEDMCIDSGIETAIYYYLYLICASIALGTAEGCLEETMKYTKQRTSNFKPISSMQAVAQNIARLKVLTSVANSAIYDAASLFNSPETIKEAYLKSQITKVFVPDIAVKVTRECLKLHGGFGYHDAKIYHYFADAVSTMIMDMTTEYHLEGIANLIGIDVIR
ncbi:MAG TPA: acyl-CoA dehydrogenase family protein [Syntrophomonas sp.]|nr:acyl-CoA dehydrogenase family protein [Syntrophomonas sp.]